ncbi:MAG: hypothetical protein U0401_21170 [Anaerolineae bacterium]
MPLLACSVSDGLLVIGDLVEQFQGGVVVIFGLSLSQGIQILIQFG